MKNCKFLIIALLLSILTLPSSGQSRRYDDYGRSSRSGSAIKGVEWGVLAGLNFPHFSTSGPDFGIDNRLGWQAGLQIGLKFRYFTIGPEVLYVRQSIKLSHADYGTLKIKTNSIDIPLIFSLRALPMLRINVGPVFTVMNDCKYAEATTRCSSAYAPDGFLYVGPGVEFRTYTDRLPLQRAVRFEKVLLSHRRGGRVQHALLLPGIERRICFLAYDGFRR